MRGRGKSRGEMGGRKGESERERQGSSIFLEWQIFDQARNTKWS